MPEQDVQEDVEVDRDFQEARRQMIDLRVGMKALVTDTVQEVIAHDVFHHDGHLVVMRRTDDGCELLSD